MKWFKPKQDPSPETVQTEDGLMALADVYLDKGNDELAFKTFAIAAQKFPNNERAPYNMGSMLALGKGVPQNFVEASYWFRVSASRGNEKAESLMTHCILDEMKRLLQNNTPPAEYFDCMKNNMKKIDANQEMDHAERAAHYITEFGNLLVSQKNYPVAAKLFRIAAEFGEHGPAQNMLGVLYNAGAGVEQNDLISLYWFDKAHDNGVKEATPDRFGIFNAYMQNLEPEEFNQYMRKLSEWCRTGTEDIPADPEKAAFWFNVSQ